MRSAARFLAVGLCLLGWGGGLLRAQTATVVVSGDLVIKGNVQQQEGDRYLVSGTVEVRYRSLVLFADRAEVNNKTKDVVAEGNVTLQLPNEVVSAERLAFNLDTALGKIEKALGFLQPTIRYETASIERKTDTLYAFEKPTFTTCTQPTPRWSFTCSRANFKKNDYIEMWNAVVSVKKVPIFYLPYMRYPLDQDRSTGFLTPQIGFSQTKGLILSQDFFWAIARNMDATFSLDAYSTKGLGGGVRLRYVFGDGTAGEAQFYAFRYKKSLRTAGGESLANLPASTIVRVNHAQVLPLNFNLVAAVDYQNSFDFLKEFDNNFRRAL
ncbi:MAG: LPS-assembly protein LptD, partial [Candidatus Aminicenantes bacterium]|nr:LPS-assembly protein LptD [Candidatus Aminicenantes bacterium]